LEIYQNEIFVTFFRIIKFPSKTISSARLYLGLTNSEFCTAVANPKFHSLLQRCLEAFISCLCISVSHSTQTIRQPGDVTQPIASCVGRVAYRAWRYT